MDYKKSADGMMRLVKKVVDEIGPRLPGSDEERAAAKLISSEYEKNIGLKTVSEPFKVAPLSTIGFIPYLGYIAICGFLLFFIMPIFATIAASIVLIYAFTMVFVYTDIFKFLWSKKDSENFYTVQEARSGKSDFTIILGAHYDSSWHWILQYNNPKTFLPKLALGIVAVLMLFVTGIVLTATGNNVPIWTAIANYSANPWSATQWTMLILPLLLSPGLVFLTLFLSHDKSIASPGAMDNLSGIALNMEIAKHFNANPEELPDNCRLVAMAFGCEEAGLKGSMAFVKKHKTDGLLNNAYFINTDAVSDGEYFEVVTGDLMQLTNFDPEMIKLGYECLQETGVVKKTGKIINPIGGCDSTPFAKAGVPTVTIAAQNPVPSTYYHTKDDRPERLSTEVFAQGLEVIYRFVKKICDKETSK
ncbi:MAG: M20/M25/M40 family metallo-hydrolase [Clostridia bacterium]|nr:M20/M25/M40 family metallo-hydrolase [Clostridia bacterium]